jgi:hypothetical protein
VKDRRANTPSSQVAHLIVWVHEHRSSCHMSRVCSRTREPMCATSPLRSR